MSERRLLPYQFPADPGFTPEDCFDEEEGAIIEVEKMFFGLWYEEPHVQMKYIKKFKEFLSKDIIPPIDNILKSGIVPRIVEFLKKEDNTSLQIEAAGILNDIAAKTPEHTKVVIDHGVVPIFVNLLSDATADDGLVGTAVEALGTVAFASTEYRDYVLRCGALMPLLAQLDLDKGVFSDHSTIDTLSKICYHQPRPPNHQMQPVISALGEALQKSDFELKYTLLGVSEALSYLSDGSEENIRSFIDAGLLPRLVQLLSSCLNKESFEREIDHILHIIKNIVEGDAQSVIDCGALPILAKLLTKTFKYYPIHAKNTQRNTCWTISKITAGSGEQIQSVIDENLIPTMVNLVQNAELDIKKLLVWGISNAASGGSHDQIKYLVKQGCTKPLCDLLVCPDVMVISACLDGLENILKAGEATGEVNNYCQRIEDAEGLDKIENLLVHESDEIYEKALKILKTYWDEEETQQPPR